MDFSKDDLPQELLKELRIEDRSTEVVDTRRTAVADLFKTLPSGTELNLNQIMIAIYRNTNEVWKRSTAQRTVSKMVEAGEFGKARRGVFKAI